MKLSYTVLCFLFTLALSADPIRGQADSGTLDIDDDGFAIDEHFDEHFSKFEPEPWKHIGEENVADEHELHEEHEEHQNHHEEEDLHFNSTDEPLMLFSTGISIKGYWMRSKKMFDVATVGVMRQAENMQATHAISFILDMISLDTTGPSKSDVVTLKSRSTIVGVDMDPSSKEVFWVELGKDAGVYSTIIDNEHFESHHKRAYNAGSKYSNAVIDSGLLSPEDIALDLVAKNIYVTDAGLPAVVVCTLKHSHCKIIVKDNISKPRAIVVDSTTGWLAYSDWGHHPGIFLVTMDGRRRETLIDTDVVWPNALTLDHSTNYLYWADAKLNKIERVDLKTKLRYSIVKDKTLNPFSLTQFENRIYWSDWGGNQIRTCDKITGNGTRNVMDMDNVYGIHIFHPNISQKQVELNDPCWSRHCSHMCLLTPLTSTFANRREGSITATCACPESMSLGMIDKSTCYETHRSYLLINVKDYVAQMFPERIGLQVIDKVIYAKNHSINDIALNPIHQKLYLFDGSQKRLHIVNLASNHIKVEPFMTLSHSIRGLVYDPLSDNLFWLDPENGTLSMCLIRGKVELVLRKGLDRPTSLVLDTRNRVLYLGLAGIKPRIIRADILGNERLDLNIVDTEITTPVAMQLDETRQRLYWADASHETIESIDLDARSMTSGIKTSSRIIHRKTEGWITAFAVYQDSLLWTVKKSDYVFKAKIFVGNTTEIMNQHLIARITEQEQQHPLTYKLPQSDSWLFQASDSRTKMILVEPRYQSGGCWNRERDCKYGCVSDANNSTYCICPTDSNQLEFCEDVDKRQVGDTSMVWLIVLLLLLSVIGLITLVSLLTLYKQGKIPTQVSQFSVSFISPNRNKDGAMLLLDTDG